MNESRAAARTLMACLGEESRFRLVQALIGGARCVTELATEVGLSQSCTTRHLQALERRRVVRRTRDGKRVLYRIREDDPGLLPLLGWALSEPKGVARSATRRSEPSGPGAVGRRTDRPSLGTGTRPIPGPGTQDGRVRSEEPRPAILAVIEPPSQEPSQGEDARPPGRRIGPSEIEDYLL